MAKPDNSKSRLRTLPGLKQVFSFFSHPLPWKVTTSTFTNEAARAFIKPFTLDPVAGQPIRMKATRKANGNYDVTLNYYAWVEDFEPFSKGFKFARPATKSLGHDMSPRDTLSMFIQFEQAGLGRRIHLNTGKGPRKSLDGATHIRTIARDKRIMSHVRPRLYAASRIKKMRHNKPGPKAG